MAGLSSYHGKVIRVSESTEIRSFFSDLKRVVLGDVSALETLIRNGEPIPFTGIFSQSSLYTRVISVGNNSAAVNGHCFDIFGYSGTTPLVLRIKGWKPTFLARVPIGAEPTEYINTIYEVLYEQGGKSAGVVGVSRRIIKCPEFSRFEFGRHGTYVDFMVQNAAHGRALADAAKIAYSRAWKKVDTCPDVLKTGWERETHKLELTTNPVYFTNNFSDSSMIYQFMSETGMPVCGHYTIKTYRTLDTKKAGLLYRYGIEIDWPDEGKDYDSPGHKLHIAEQLSSIICSRVVTRNDEDYFGNAICVPYDIETYYDETCKIPRPISDPRIIQDYIMTIGLQLYQIKEAVPLISIVLLPSDHKTTPIKDCLTIMCADEKALLHTFTTILRMSGHSFLNSYNGEVFDNRYINIRAHMRGLANQFLGAFDNYRDSESVGKRVRINQNATFKMDGINRDKLTRPQTTQKGSADTYLYVARLHPKELQESRSLNSMLKYLQIVDPESGEQMAKMDMPIKHMYELWKKNEPEGIHDVARYCMIDSKGAYLILRHINQLQDAFLTAHLSYTLVPDSLHRADGMRITQALTRKCREMGFAFADETSSDYRDASDEVLKIGGGDVRVILSGKFKYVISLDYSSMYPTQKEGSNIGCSSKVVSDMILHPNDWDLVIAKEEDIVDQYCSVEIPDRATRKRYWIYRKEDALEITDESSLMECYNSGKVYKLEQFYAEASSVRETSGNAKSWKTHFVQSRIRTRSGTIIPDNFIDHYSVQAEWLIAKRAERKSYQRELGVTLANLKQVTDKIKVSEHPVPPKLLTEAAHLKAWAAVLDTKQLGTKRSMNSEYGIGANSAFPLYDQDVAATVTYASRRLAELLRRLLTSSTIIIPDVVAENPEVVKLVGSLKEVLGDQISIEKLDKSQLNNTIWVDSLNRPMIELRLVEEGRSIQSWYQLKIPPSEVIYQDTDSNYYVNHAIVDAFPKEKWVGKEVECAKLIWKSMLDHNDLFAIILRDSVARAPTSVSCDGGFIAAYYSPQKKQYMGVKGPVSRKDIATISDTHLRPVLSDFDTKISIAEYLRRRNVKVTGYLIIKRDTPTYVIKYLLRYCERLLSSVENVDVVNMAHQLIRECYESSSKPLTQNELMEYSKQQKYKPTANNDMQAIVRRLREENKYDLIPMEYSVARYVVTAGPDTGKEVKGMLDSDKKRNRMRLISEFDGNPDLRVDVRTYTMKLARALTNLVYEEVIDLEIRTLLKSNAPKANEIANKYGRLLSDYNETLAVNNKELTKKAYGALVAATVAILVRPYFTAPGYTSDNKRRFRDATAEVAGSAATSSGIMESSNLPSIRLKYQKLMKTAFDRSKPAGELAESMIAKEKAAAIRRRKLIMDEKQCHVTYVMQVLKTDSDRTIYFRDNMEKVAAFENVCYRSLAGIYAELLSKLQSINQQLCGELLRRRKNRENVPLDDVLKSIPMDQYNMLIPEITDLNGKTELYKRSVAKRVALERAFEEIKNMR